ncbi:Arc family DNA-binding protein [Ensifer aridi]|uniref:Arc family DNA-binding protein n=1 Tax=Ensifer aridi TaxID=1708715 RepID=UPI000A102AE5|nr:Arc family DNA-binding protein [Ensifer aridi]
MSANRTNSDQFQLRLPPGLRDRIKAYAERHGRSTNAEIIRVLEREFPPPATLEERVEDILDLLVTLRSGTIGAKHEDVEKLSDMLEETLRDIASGRIPAGENIDRDDITRGLQAWQLRRDEEAMDRFKDNLDEDEDWPYRGVDPFKG